MHKAGNVNSRHILSGAKVIQISLREFSRSSCYIFMNHILFWTMLIIFVVYNHNYFKSYIPVIRKAPEAN